MVFKMTPDVSRNLWNLIKIAIDGVMEQEDLVWVFSFAKNYSTENTNVMVWICEEKTFRNVLEQS